MTGRDKIKTGMAVAGCAASLIGLPLAGVRFGQKRIAEYLEFPPLTRHVEHAGFSWPAFILLAAGILAFVLPFVVRAWRSPVRTEPAARHVYPMPGWGWAGLLILAAGWCLAWTRFGWFAAWQRHTFTIPWLGYIILVNGLTRRRSGRCMMTHRPLYFGLLFLFSAVFWWLFEYLNRFVQNWYYVDFGALSGAEYFLLATLPFSTVLPAVLGTWDLLLTFPNAGAGLDSFVKIRAARPAAWAWAVALLSCAGLCGVGLLPDYLFPLLWLAPLALMVSVRAILGKPTLFAPLREGRWRALFLLGAAGLICGFFWELWNFHSLARWEYAVPFVGRFKLFEMPVLGYAGYIPFALECAVAGELAASVCPRSASRNQGANHGSTAER